MNDCANEQDTHLGGLKAASTDIALPKDALIAQDAVGLILLIVQEVAELPLARVLSVYLCESQMQHEHTLNTANRNAARTLQGRGGWRKRQAGAGVYWMSQHACSSAV